jgi:hypothetical protein
MYVKYLDKIFTLTVFDTVRGCIYNIYKTSFSPDSVLSEATQATKLFSLTLLHEPVARQQALNKSQ